MNLPSLKEVIFNDKTKNSESVNMDVCNLYGINNYRSYLRGHPFLRLN